ncbi:hypothetical protein [Actinomadura sp. 7K507]|uniref:hypothetical protein n=1 Tax=Actinomadura sp. 7K507 TaxID=2530365 RepID=UPI00104F5A98|nr:hypothetical protein [Actinomadura sp. 7K507]TDC85135.1 hypothetical protein E1285_25645 [Actinomadura sp. 7K507]
MKVGSGHRIGTTTDGGSDTQWDHPDQPQLTVTGSLDSGAQDHLTLRQTSVDGSTVIAIGAAIGSAFGVEAVPFATGDNTARWWFVLACLTRHRTDRARVLAA